MHNDLGFGVKNSRYFECAAQGQAPGDCGEGVHFTAVAYSAITGSLIADNAGGVLLSDDTGPTHHNLVARQCRHRHSTDCGITVPGHTRQRSTPRASRSRRWRASTDNVIRGNTVTNNGLKGEGAGVLFANAMAGTPRRATWSRTTTSPGTGCLRDDTAHTIKPGQFEDLGGNNVISNYIGKNNLDGDTLDCPPHSTCKPQDLVTTGVLVFSGGARVTVTITRTRSPTTRSASGSARQ